MSHADHAAQPFDCLGCQVLDTLDHPSLIFDGEGRIVFWNQGAATFTGITRDEAVGQMASDLLASQWNDPVRRAEAARELHAGRPWATELEQTKEDGSRVTVRATIRPISDGDGRPHFVMTMVDITTDRALAEQRDLLAAAVDQASESVVITDVAANILYVNPAFEEVSGYHREEVLGKNPRVLKSGHQGPQFYQQMWSRLSAGEVFRAEFENRRKDGSLYQEIASISPVRGPDGATKHYVAVKRDVTRQRTFERRIEREARERATAMDAIGTIRPGSNAEATAQAIATTLVDRCGFTHVALLSFEADDQAITLAIANDGNGAEVMPRVLSTETSLELIGRASVGPWIERTGRRMAAHRRIVGIGGLAHAPILYGGEVVGLMAVGFPAIAGPSIAGGLDFLVEVAAMVAGLIGPALDERRATTSSRRRIRDVMAHAAFHPVFQPIADLATGAVIGQEALTRFDDQTPPDVVFATAARCGLGLDLEEQTIAAALEAAGSLPANSPLHVNVSPALILDEDRLRRQIARSGWNVILEVTEHEPVADYDELRAALGRIGRGIELAVDDAGAGFASLRHILELHPHVVKLDRYLVAAIDGDPARQALVAGMVHFATSSGFDLIAEGVETDAERMTLLGLGVRSGQGWLFGRPARAPEVSRTSLPMRPKAAVLIRPPRARSRSGRTVAAQAAPGRRQGG